MGQRGTRDVELAESLRKTLRARLVDGDCSADEIARHFLMTRRTLSRRLRAEGTAFRRITEEVRFEAACELLANTGTPCAEVATALGFSEPSAFTRAFRRWTGETPSAWSARHRGSATAR